MADCLWPCIHLGHHTSDPSRKDVVAGMTKSSAVRYHVARCERAVGQAFKMCSAVSVGEEQK